MCVGNVALWELDPPAGTNHSYMLKQGEENLQDRTADTTGFEVSLKQVKSTGKSEGKGGFETVYSKA